MIQNILKPPIIKTFQDRAIAALSLNNQDKVRARTIRPCARARDNARVPARLYAPARVPAHVHIYA